MRLPFLFQAFEVESERISLRILKGLGRFEGRGDISAETIASVILNEGLRARLQSEKVENGDAEIVLIRDALLEAMKARAAGEADKAQQLQDTLLKKEAALGVLAASGLSKDEELKRLNTKLVLEASRATAADEKLTASGAEVSRLKADLERIEDGRNRRFALFRYLWLLAIVILAASAAAWKADRLAPNWARVIGSESIKALAAIMAFVAGHLLLEWVARTDVRMTRLWPFDQIRRFRRWLWGFVVIGFAVGVLGNLYANRIQKQMDREPTAPAISRSRPPSAAAADSAGTPDQK